MSAATPRALAIAHDADSGSGLVGERLEERGFVVDTHVLCPDLDRPDRFVPLPPAAGYDLLLPMGSIWSVFDEATIGAWIGSEMAMLGDAHRAGTPVLGICFGGQALAAALGGRVERSPVTEVGWFEIAPVDGAVNPVGPGPWMQWHHDRFEAPPGAEILAQTETALQLYRIDQSVGTQFHPEVDVAHVQQWLRSARDDYLDELGVVREDILAEVARHEAANRAQCRALVDWFLDDISRLG